MLIGNYRCVFFMERFVKSGVGATFLQRGSLLFLLNSPEAAFLAVMMMCCAVMYNYVFDTDSKSQTHFTGSL